MHIYPMVTNTTFLTKAQKFNIPDFCKRYRLVRGDITRMTQYSPRAVAKWVAGDKPSPAAGSNVRPPEGVKRRK